MTETALAELLAADLSGLDLVAVMIDGVHFAASCCVVALGIGIDGVKHPLALVEGSTENATLVTALLVDLRDRGLDVTRPMLVGIDGSKALRKAVLYVLDHATTSQRTAHHLHRQLPFGWTHERSRLGAWVPDHLLVIGPLDKPSGRPRAHAQAPAHINSSFRAPHARPRCGRFTLSSSGIRC